MKIVPSKSGNAVLANGRRPSGAEDARIGGGVAVVGDLRMREQDQRFWIRKHTRETDDLPLGAETGGIDASTTRSRLDLDGRD